MVTGQEVNQVMGNTGTATAPGGGILREEDVTHEPKVQFSPRLRSDGMWDERFVSRDQLDDLIAGINGKHSAGPDGVPNSVIKLLPDYIRRWLLVVLNNVINLN